MSCIFGGTSPPPKETRQTIYLLIIIGGVPVVKAIVGANWGDEGKGKITDLLAET